MLDQAFDALRTYDWGADPKVLSPINEAVVATHGNAAARQELEARLAAVLPTDATRDAKDFVCRQLMVIGTAASVPALTQLLMDANLSHMARYALERIPASEAAQALRDALPKLSAVLKVGAIASLGVRGETDSVPDLAQLLDDADDTVASAAALALGAIRGAAAARALTSAKPRAEVKPAITDASLACAESLLKDGQKTAALAIYKAVSAGDPPKHVRLAATRGMLACAGG